MFGGRLIIKPQVTMALAALAVMGLVAQAKSRRPAVDAGPSQSVLAAQSVASKPDLARRPMAPVQSAASEPGRVSAAAAPQAAVAPALASTAQAQLLEPRSATGSAVAARPQSADTAPNPARTTDTLEITNADRISIKIQGQAELSGEYRINDDQTISIPVLGRVPVTNLDAAGLERALSERLARMIGREAFVTVEVVEYRPVFISGYVSKPGTAPWKPGMTVLQAVTLSGGTYRSADAIGPDGGSTKLQRAVDDQKRVLATIARLTAEQNGADKIEIPSRLIALVGSKEAQELIDAQQTSFLSRRSATEAQISGLKRSIALAKQEIESVRAQRARLSDQLKFRRDQFARLKVLYDKQFLRIDRLTEEELKISDLEEKIASLGVSISRTDSTLVGLERDLSNIRQDRRALIDTDLLKLERDSAQLELEIEAAGPQPRRLSRPQSDADMKDGQKKEILVFEIVRQNADGPKSFAAERNTPLKPGDMLVVSTQ